MGLFLIFIIGLGWVFSYLYDNYIVLIVAVVWSATQVLISYYYSDKITLAISRAKEAPRSEPYLLLHRTAENLAIAAGLPKPKIYVIEDTALNAFATGRDPKHAAVTITTGLLEKLENEELEGVIAHEMSHVGNYDIRLMTIIVVLVGIVALVSDLFLRWQWIGGSRRDNKEGQGYLMIIALLMAILAPIAATLIQLAISRKREFLADASGALLTRYPEGLASALEKIAGDKEILEAANRATAHLYIVNPFKGKMSAVTRLFMTHPPIGERVKALRSMA